MNRFSSHLLVGYLIISILRGITLIPSTPFVFAGVLLFPDQPLLVLTISIIAIGCSTTFIYFFSHLLNLEKAIGKMYPQDKLQKKLNSPLGVFFVFLWSFFPVVPTDAVSFAAGAIKMNFTKFILAVLSGELIICSFYVFMGREFFSWIF
ncbi:MAG: TVP38/TMEM64 family protein [Ferruginibacter sp.]|nr:TVP38/TMEM64 family protein [Ferruginibacter sp.]